MAIAQESDAAELLRLLVRCIAHLDGFRVGQAYRATPDSDPVWCSAWHSGDSDVERFVQKSRCLGSAGPGSLPARALADGEIRVLNPPDRFLDETRRNEALQAGLEAGFAIPIKVRDRAFAVLEFYRSEPMSPGDPIPLVAEALAAHVGTALALKTAETECEQLEAGKESERGRAEVVKGELDAMKSIMASVHAELPTIKMVQGCVEALRSGLHVDAVAAFGTRRGSVVPEQLALSSSRNVLPIPGDCSEIVGSMTLGKSPIALERLHGNDQKTLQAIFVAPLVVEEERIGALVLFHHHPKQVTPHMVRLVRITADRIAPRMSRARVIEEAWRDRQELEMLSRKLVTAHESERRAISRDLHDEVGQVIAALKFSFEASGTRSELVQTALASLMQQVRNIAQRLRPSVLDDFGLAPTLEWHARQFSEQTGIRVDFRRFGVCGRYHPDLEIALYRVVQEALTNAVRHARASRARVVLRTGRGWIGVRVRDYGTGFDSEGIPSGSTGIAGMKERLRPLRGELVIQSRRGRGTSVTATVPFNPEARIMNEPITVVLADDHRIMREALKVLLEGASFQVVGQAGDGLEAVNVVENAKPSVLLLDVAMPGLGGADVVKQVAKRTPRTRVLMLSMHANDAYVSGSMKNGAAGYVLKDASADELFHAIREVAEGRRYLSRPLEESGVADRDLADAYETLTMREREVLHLAAEGLTSAQIADRLSISPRTAETHRANSLRKLNIRGQTELVRYAIGRGILPAPV
ncbi:MAG TPA: response regulator [Candidatus Eisenbacteria bacterium]|nr:response regulator [Candidatus Eisenbacteria bacterium]